MVDILAGALDCARVPADGEGELVVLAASSLSLSLSRGAAAADRLTLRALAASYN